MNVKRTILCLQRQKCQRKGNYLIHFTSKIQMLIFSKEITEIYNDQQRPYKSEKSLCFREQLKRALVIGISQMQSEECCLNIHIIQQKSRMESTPLQIEKTCKYTL